MCDDDIHQGLTYDSKLSRRAFGALTVAASAAASTALAADVVEKDVEVKTADGICDAALYYPSGKGKWPAVLIWPDIVGLRPVFREMGRRLASSGYVVLVVNPFYRSKKAPVVGDSFDFNNADDRKLVFGFRAAMTNEGIDKDSAAYVAFLDAQPQTDRKHKVGVQGYCMGGPLSFRTAAAAPDRIGAVASFHGGGLTTKDAASPHLLVPKTKATYLVDIAENDDKAQPDSKDILKKTFADAGRPATVQVYAGCAHGWTVKGSAVYNEAGAEKAWGELLKLYKTAL